ncbi:MAG: AhpC/TSA family protein [Marinilabiliaceae bacterium]|nr:AhpC/TSA family protein [Marinilabiliaceae bacterium]
MKIDAMMTKQMLLSGLVLFLALMNLGAQGYKIQVEIGGVKDTSVILGYYAQSKMYVSDTIQVDSRGRGVFTGEKPLPQGMYLVYLPNQTYFDFLVGSDQQFAMKTHEPDYVKNLVITGADESERFLSYQRLLMDRQTEAKELQQKLEALKEQPDSSKFLQERLQQMGNDVKDLSDRLIQENPKTMLALFLTGLKAVEVPEFTVEDSVVNKDSVLQHRRYYYYKHHYFDHLDLTDDRLIRTPYFHGKLENYLTKTVIQHPDTLTAAAIGVIEKARPNAEMFRYMVQYFFNYANDSKMMGMDAMLVALGEKYYLSGDATWADEEFLTKLKDRVVKIKPNLLGLKAHDMKLESLNGEFFRLSEISAPYTILAFWEPSCGHCKKEIPALFKDVFEKYKDKGIKVMAVYTQIDTKEWHEFVEANHLEGFGWYNVFDRYQQSGFRDHYDIFSTPVIYILDRDKKIVAKRIGVENIPGFFDHEISQGRL